MKNNKKVQTIKDYIIDSGYTVDEYLSTEMKPEYDEEVNSNEIMHECLEAIRHLTLIISRVVKNENILGAMANFLLSRYHDLARLHRVDLDFDEIEKDKDEMYKVFDENK